MALSIYKITVIKFNEHNSSLKKGHKATLISNNFCDDSKLGTLPVTVRWLFLGILLTCGDHTRDTVEMNERQLRALLESSWSIDRALDALKELQLLSYQKTPPNIIEKKRKEEKRKEKNSEAPQKNSDDNPKTGQLWAAYCDAYNLRYKVQPVRNPKVMGQLSQLAKRVGKDADLLIRFYLQHNDSQYLKAMHSIGLCLMHAEALHTQMLRGMAITSTMLRQNEKTQQTRETLDRIDREGI